MRSTVALFLTLAILVPLEGGLHILKTRNPGKHLIRGICIVIANMTFFLGLSTISLPEATSIFFVAPLFITALSVLFLGEQVGWLRWLAIAIGLVGVIIILRPGSEAFKLAALLPLLAALAYAISQVFVRKIGLADRASAMAFYIQVLFVLVCVLFGFLFGDGRFAPGNDGPLDFMFRAWRIPEREHFLVMIGLGVTSGMGGYFISQAYRVARAVLIAPFEYVALPLSIFWSVVVFGVWPGYYTWLGIALIIGSGLFVFVREVQVKNRQVVNHRMPRNR